MSTIVRPFARHAGEAERDKFRGPIALRRRPTEADEMPSDILDGMHAWRPVGLHIAGLLTPPIVTIVFRIGLNGNSPNYQLSCRPSHELPRELLFKS